MKKLNEAPRYFTSDESKQPGYLQRRFKEIQRQQKVPEKSPEPNVILLPERMKA